MAVVETTIGDTHFYLHYGRKGEVKPKGKNLIGVSKMCRAMLLGKTGKNKNWFLVTFPAICMEVENWALGKWG